MDAEFVGLVINIAVIIWKIVIQFGITTAWVPPNRFAINSLISCVNDPIQVPENRRNWFYFRINWEGGGTSWRPLPCQSNSNANMRPLSN